MAQPVDVRGQVGLRARAGRHVLVALAHGGREHALHAWWDVAGQRGGRERQAVSRGWRDGDGARTRRGSRGRGGRRPFAESGERRDSRRTLRECLDARRHGDRWTRTRANRVAVSRARRMVFCRARPAARSLFASENRAGRGARRRLQSPVSNSRPSTDQQATSNLAPCRDIFPARQGATLIARRASVAVRALPPVAMASRSALRRGIAAFAEATRGLATGNALARQGGVTANRYDAPAIYL